MKRIFKNIFVYLLLFASIFGIVATNNLKVDAWSVEYKGATKEGEFVSELCSFQGWYSDDLEAALIKYGFGTDEKHVICGYYEGFSAFSNGYRYDFNLGCGASTDDIAVGMKFTNDINQAITSVYVDVKDYPEYSTSLYRNVNGFNVCYHVVGGYYVDDDTCTPIVAQDFNATAGGQYVYLYYAKDPRIGSPITSFDLTFNENYVTNHTPLAFEKYVKRSNGEDGDFNHGTSGIHIYLSYVDSTYYTRNLYYNIDGEVRTDPNNIYCYHTLPSTFLNIPDKIDENHILEGWYFDPEFKYRATEGAVIDPAFVKDNTFRAYKTTLYAHIVSGEGGDVTYNTNGSPDSFAKLDDVKYLPDKLPIPSKEGYIFTGWYYDEQLTKKANAKDQVYHDITLYAGYEEGNLIGGLALFFDNDKYTMSDLAVDKGMKLYSYNLGNNYENFYEVHLGVAYTNNAENAITNIMLIDEATFNALGEDKLYTDPSGIVYTPVSGYASEEKYAQISIYSKYLIDGSIDESDNGLTDYYLYATKDSKAGKPIKDIKFSANASSDYQKVNIAGEQGTELANLKVSRYENIYTGSVISTAQLWIIIGGCIFVVGAIAFGLIYYKKKKQPKQN